MKKVGGAHVQNMVLQDNYSVEEVKTAGEQEDNILSAIEEQCCGSSHAPWVSGTEQMDTAVEVIKELAKLNESLSTLLQSVSRFKV